MFDAPSIAYMIAAALVAGLSVKMASRNLVKVAALYNLFSCVTCNLLRVFVPTHYTIDPVSIIDVFASGMIAGYAFSHSRTNWAWGLYLSFLLQIIFHFMFMMELITEWWWRFWLNRVFELQEITILFAATNRYFRRT